MELSFFNKKTKDTTVSANLKFVDINPLKFSRDTGMESLIPGSIIKIDYLSEWDRIILIVSTERASLGKFISTRNKYLLCSVQLQPRSPSFKLIIRLFHKNQSRSRYSILPKFLRIIFGSEAFRTFEIRKIRNPSVLSLKTVQELDIQD